MLFTQWRVMISAKVPQEGGQWLYFLTLYFSHASMHSKVTSKSLTRIEFLLQLIKKMRRDPSTKSDFSPLPTMVLKRFSQTLRKKKQCQLQLCKKKSSVSCHKCLKSCCGRHPTFTFIVATCSSCAIERS